MAHTVPATMWPMASRKPPSGQRERAAHQRDQQEDQLAGIHVAEQPHAVRHGLGDELDHLHREVERVQQPVVAEGRREQFVDPAAQALDLDVVDQADEQHADRQAHRDRQVGGGHDAQVGVRRVMPRSAVDPAPDLGQQIDRQQVHRIEQEDPDEDRQRQRRHQLAAVRVVHDALGLARRPSRPGFPPRPGSGPARPRWPCAPPATAASSRSTPITMVKKTESKLTTEKSTRPSGLPVLQMRQVVNDVFTGGGRVSFGCHRFSPVRSCSQRILQRPRHSSASQYTFMHSTMPTSNAGQLRGCTSFARQHQHDDRNPDLHQTPTT